MIKYSFKYSNAHQTILAERTVDFVCTAWIWLDKFSWDKELQKTIKKIDNKYWLADSLYSSLYTQQLRTKHPYSNLGNIFKRIEEKIVVDTSNTDKDDLYHELLNDDKKLFNSNNPSLYAHVQYQWHKDSLDMSNDKFETKSYELEIHKLYLIYLYLTNISGKLFRCINTLYEDINIVDSYNLASYMWTNPNIIIPLQELIRWNKVIKHNIVYADDMIPRELWYKKWFIEKLQLEFEDDIDELRASHRYIWNDLLLECEQWLWNTDTHKLTIENKKNYRLLKPTLLKNKEKTKHVEEAIDSYWSIEIKKHILNWAEARQVFLTPSYKIWKHKKKTV